MTKLGSKHRIAQEMPSSLSDCTREERRGRFNKEEEEDTTHGLADSVSE